MHFKINLFVDVSYMNSLSVNIYIYICVIRTNVFLELRNVIMHFKINLFVEVSYMNSLSVICLTDHVKRDNETNIAIV